MPAATTPPSSTRQEHLDSMEVDQQPRSPSPSLPAPPVPDAPGPRAQALMNAFDKALENTLRRCNYENFASCFPTPAEYRGETLDMFWREFVGRLESFCKENFEQLLSDRAIVPSLNELHRLIEDAKMRKQAAQTEADATSRPLDVPVAPHTLSPEELLSSHLAPFLSIQHDNIMAQLAEVQATNQSLADEIQAQRAELQRLIGGLADVVGDLERSAEIMRQEEVQGLVEEVRNIEAELRG